VTKSVEFYFDFGSPTAYLAYRRLRQLAQAYGLRIEYRPMLLGGVFKATGNTSPVAIPAKGQ
jgi:2-hydroxychromene-2-carboxylate isomerase